ncbi:MULTISPECIES: GapA-binding peptide SR1P [Paenibacillus]|uniref:GapA-binding peptide SR1P n=1 Tax=Paenibacillus chondroitinus TaxID=59842 RepID=A0ABU6D9R6_9BACL|nr:MULTISPECIES: GapA-binding peptide SR1P [Paenibacillus]MCY9656837.1 GapA-binding peptide SR1P [Paenibacillus anseongense]MEB4794487.1 GapA-binding peptide SR1P [Paenibacillus chondroitinus]
MSHTISVTMEAGVAAQPNELGLIICKSCNEVLATLPTDGYKKFYVVCPGCARKDNNKEASE